MSEDQNPRVVMAHVTFGVVETGILLRNLDDIAVFFFGTICIRSTSNSSSVNA
ncbi:MAG: hypothetical protein ACSLEN_03280 [Candidatus Malihini olakiniferum]